MSEEDKKEYVIVQDGIIYDFNDENLFTKITSFYYFNPATEKYDNLGYIYYLRKDNNTYYKLWTGKNLSFDVISKKDLIYDLDRVNCSIEAYEKAGIVLKKLGDSENIKPDKVRPSRNGLFTMLKEWLYI